jgi:Flp pilus assembly protein TadD
MVMKGIIGSVISHFLIAALTWFITLSFTFKTIDIPLQADKDHTFQVTGCEEARWWMLTNHKKTIAAYNEGVLGLLSMNSNIASTKFQEAIKLKPKYAYAYNSLGVALWKLGKPRDAQEAFLQAIRLKNNYALAYTNLGTAQMMLGALGEAVTSFQEAIRFNPHLAQANYGLGEILLKQNKYNEAEAALRKATFLMPDYPQAHFSLGITLIKQKKFKEGLKEIGEAKTMEPDSIWNNRMVAEVPIEFRGRLGIL